MYDYSILNTFNFCIKHWQSIPTSIVRLDILTATYDSLNILYTRIIKNIIKGVKRIVGFAAEDQTYGSLLFPYSISLISYTRLLSLEARGYYGI